ncbi:MerR family transcriptional regulator [Marinobacter apostichopi]|uniref:MerR family transcriptional regulator n=1 Tax=Marinobacter apostichopi TaxID=3035454 RepID=UPI002572B4A8|nr:MerR family transcriptional regulator [Marinobacter sp. LA51]
MMRIGELAKAAGVNSSAIRYYEDLGLLTATTRSAGGYRLFDQAASQRLQLIQFGQRLGFTLDDMQSLFSQTEGWDHDDVMDRLNQKIAESETMIAALQQTHKTMLALRNKLETTWDRGDCLQTDELAALIGSNGKND